MTMKAIPKITTAIIFLLIINFSNSYSSPRNVLIEYITGTWCGNCPCGHQTLDTITSMYPQTIIIAYHAFSNDPWRQFYGNEIVNLLGFSATPTAAIDRNNVVGLGNYHQWITGVQSRYSSSPDAKIKLNIASKLYNSSTRELSITLNSTALEYLEGQYKVNFVIIENNLIYQQNHYSQCGTPGYVPDYVHDHVARNMINGAPGENLNTDNMWIQNKTFSKTVSTVLESQWIAENCKIVMFVYKAGSMLAQSTVEQSIEDNVTGTSGISGNSTLVVSDYYLSQNYPNPFNPSTNIKFNLPEDGNVSFKVYDIYGKEVENYVDGFLQKGSYSVEFDGANLSSGIYFYALKADNFFDKKKMVLIK